MLSRIRNELGLQLITDKGLPSRVKDEVDKELCTVSSDCTDRAEPTKRLKRGRRQVTTDLDPTTETQLPASMREATESVDESFVTPDTAKFPDIATQEPTVSAPDPVMELLTENWDPTIVE